MILRSCINGDMFADGSVNTLVCPINVAGAMGKGLAKVFRDLYPGLYEFYLENYPKTDNPDPALINKLALFDPGNGGRKILLFPTKLHWRNASKAEWIEQNLRLLNQVWESWGLGHIALPALGCGEGGLDWYQQVGPLVQQHVGSTPHYCTVYPPQNPNFGMIPVDMIGESEDSPKGSWNSGR